MMEVTSKQSKFETVIRRIVLSITEAITTISTKTIFAMLNSYLNLAKFVIIMSVTNIISDP